MAAVMLGTSSLQLDAFPEQSSPKQKSLGSVSPPPFSSSPSALSHHNHALAHSFNSQALSPYSSSSRVPSTERPKWLRSSPSPKRAFCAPLGKTLTVVPRFPKQKGRTDGSACGMAQGQALKAGHPSKPRPSGARVLASRVCVPSSSQVA